MGDSAKYINGVLSILCLLLLAHIIFFFILLFNDWLYAGGVFIVVLGCILSAFYNLVVVSDWCDELNEFKYGKFKSRLHKSGSAILISSAFLLIWSSFFAIDDLFDGRYNNLEEMGVPIFGSLALSTFVLGQLFTGIPLINDMPVRIQTETKIEYKKSEEEIRQITQLELEIDQLRQRLKKRKRSVNRDKKLLDELKEKLDELQSSYDYLAASTSVIIKDKEQLEESEKYYQNLCDERYKKNSAYEEELEKLRDQLAEEMRKNSEDWDYEVDEQEEVDYETGYDHDETVNTMFSEFEKAKEEFEFDQKKERHEFEKKVSEKIRTQDELIFEQDKRIFSQREENLKSKEELLYIMQYVKEVEGEIRILDKEILHRDQINHFRLREAIAQIELERANIIHSLSNEIRDYMHESKMSFQDLNHMIHVEGIERKNLESMTKDSFRHLSEIFKEKVNRLESDVSFKFTLQGEKFANSMKESIYQMDRKIELNDKNYLEQRYKDLLFSKEQRHNDLNGIKDAFYSQEGRMNQNERDYEKQRFNDLSGIQNEFHKQDRRMDGMKSNFDLALKDLERQNIEGQYRTQLRLKDSEMQITRTLSTFAQNQMRQFNELKLENKQIGFVTEKSQMAMKHMNEWMRNFAQNFKFNNGLDQKNLLQEMLHLKQMVNKQFEVGQLKQKNDLKDVLFSIDDKLNKDAKILMMNREIANTIEKNGMMTYEQRWNIQSQINDHQKILSNLREEQRFYSHDRKKVKDVESQMFNTREQIRQLQQQMR